MANEEFYHRSFLPDGPFTSPCNRGCHGPMPPAGFDSMRNPVTLPRRESLDTNNPFQRLPQQPKLPAPGPYNVSQRRWQVQRLAGNSLSQIHVVERVNQRFKNYATSFELQFSQLCGARPALMPVVDDQLEVIGHYGWVNGRTLIGPQGAASPNLPYNLANDIPVFVIPFASNPPAGWTHISASESKHLVLTGVDGELIGEFQSSVIGIESVDFWLPDAATLAKGLAALGIGIGAKLIRSLVRRRAQKAQRQLLTGPTRELAEKSLARKSADIIESAGEYIQKTGMPPGHFKAFQQAAKDTKSIAIVRNTNPAGIPLIERGCPGKPMELSFINTDARTGVVTARSPQHIERARQEGYLVVDADGVARGNGLEHRITDRFWQVEPGQVIDRNLRKPVIGDYDLMGVAPLESKGRNLALVHSDKRPIKDVRGPDVDRFMKAVNPKLDMPRVLHGAQDQYASFRGGATAFFPDGRVRYMETAEQVADFYKSIGRATREQSYN